MGVVGVVRFGVPIAILEVKKKFREGEGNLTSLTTNGRTNWYWKMTSTAAATSATGISDDMMDLLHAVEQSPTVTTTQIGQKQEEMDAHDEKNSSKDIPFHYSNKICFLSNEDFDYMVAAKNEAETAIG